MNKKFLSAILFGALMITSTGTFVSCKDYDDDIDQINQELADLESQIAALQNKVNSGEWVSGVTSTANGVTITLGNGQTFNVTNGKDGANGAAGQNGKDGATPKIAVNDEVIQVSYDDGATWTDLVALADLQGEAAAEPIFSVGEDGHIYVQMGEDAEKKDLGVSTGGIYYVEDGPAIILHVCDKDGNWKDIKLPQTATITDMKAVTIAADGKVTDGATVVLNYGEALAADVKFNNVTYKKGSYLTSVGSSMSALVNPLNADASLYEFTLVDSKGNAPYVISNVKANATEAGLSRAATANQGAWDMSVNFAAGLDFSKAAARSAVAYALTTETYNGTIASAYDVKVAETKVTTVPVGAFTDLTKKVTESIDLTKAFPAGLMDKVVDYYFVIADKTVASANGIVLNGDILTATKPVNNVKIYVNYLLIDGTAVEGTTQSINANFTYVAPSAELNGITWTINATNKVVYLPLSSIKSSLVGNADTDIPTVDSLSIKFADGKALTEKKIKVNGVEYSSIATSSVVYNIIDKVKTYNSTTRQYVDATSIQQDLFVGVEFNNLVAFPGEYTMTLGFKKAGASVNAVEVPVNVTIVAPEQTIVKHENYFTGVNAVAYGDKASATHVKYDLAQLFKTTGLTFTETEVKNAYGVAYTPWITTGSTINVPVYSYAQYADNTVSVYSTHEFTASIIPFNNPYIQKTEYKFNLTIKSAIKEGEFSSTASKTISTSEPVKFDVTEFKGVDVYGDKFQIGETYEYDKNGNLTKVNKRDARIVKVEITAADDNAKDYLAINTFAGTFGNESGEKPAAEYFSVARKSGLTQLQNDTECKINVTVTDDWGVQSVATVTVVLKKF